MTFQLISKHLPKESSDREICFQWFEYYMFKYIYAERQHIVEWSSKMEMQQYLSDSSRIPEILDKYNHVVNNIASLSVSNPERFNKIWSFHLAIQKMCRKTLFNDARSIFDLCALFERSINQKERGERGAFYTEYEVIQYISKTALLDTINRLGTDDIDCGFENFEDVLDCIRPFDWVSFDMFGSIGPFLNLHLSPSSISFEKIKILDPTCGSGNFIHYMIELMMQLYEKMNPQKSKLELFVSIVQKHCYGVDIMPEAIGFLKIRLNLLFAFYARGVSNLASVKEQDRLFVQVLEKHFIVSDFLGEDVNFLQRTKWNCIVGNPPYVVPGKEEKSSFEHFNTVKAKNLYAYVLERSSKLLEESGVLSMIVPISIVAGARDKVLREHLVQLSSAIYFANFADRPGCLFTGVHQKCSIVRLKKLKTTDCKIFATDYSHFNADSKQQLLDSIQFVDITDVVNINQPFVKIGQQIGLDIVQKVSVHRQNIHDYFCKKSSHEIWISDRICFWHKVFLQPQKSKEYKKFCVNDSKIKTVLYALMNSNLAFWLWEVLEDGWHVRSLFWKHFAVPNIESMPSEQYEKISFLVELLQQDIQSNAKSIQTTQTDVEYKHKHSKLLIDAVSSIVERWYGLTDEMSEFLRTYSLAGRMSDALMDYQLKWNKMKKLRGEVDEQYLQSINQQYPSFSNKRTFTGVDLFAGAGGFSAGGEKAGIRFVLANEIESVYSQTYTANHPETDVLCADIKNLNNDFHGCLLERFGDRTNEVNTNISGIDIITGGPPCQGFSMAGKRIRGSAETDIRNELFNEYFKVIQKLKPKCFIMENVKGILTLDDGDFINRIETLFQSENNEQQYHIEKIQLRADNYGVPQARERLFIFGSVEPFDLDQLMDKAKAHMLAEDAHRFDRITIQDAILDLNVLNAGERWNESEYPPFNPDDLSSYIQSRKRASSQLTNHQATNHSDKTIQRIESLSPGQGRADLEDSSSIKSVHSGAYYRMQWDDIAKTVHTRFDTPSGGGFIHPEQHRCITPREAARLQSFDDTYFFVGTKSEIQTQIGNAVPPLMAEFVCRVMIEHLQMMLKN